MRKMVKHLLKNLSIHRWDMIRQSAYRLYTDLKLNPGNVNAWLKHNDSSKMSLDCARQIVVSGIEIL